ncbi:hypothetical protein EJ08DRAFT_626818 [Tothia fuscella]|uniref:Uncharacterized protein n=1 Tax=Tothia fuscella TaxID=1048955 RepID=A0A9P4NZY0_9PEZI|nr:hypothetical protein EJ08DRAFT_626818 [Tothia fuscella]
MIREESERPNPNVNGFSAALSCYPIASSLACHLDLNTLHNLSRACRQFRANLLQYRTQLIAQSLRCSKEGLETNVRLADGLRAASSAFRDNHYGKITSGKVGRCARDMVSECRRCNKIVCRNCTAKPPPGPELKRRHRRLCKTCVRTPLALLTTQTTPSSTEEMSTPSSSPSASPTRIYRLPTPSTEEGKQMRAFTASAFARDPCCCLDTVWLCQECGHTLKKKDDAYVGVWEWRSNYTTFLGGIGTGIGEGNEGEQCGRKERCLAAKMIEQESACDAETIRAEAEKAEKVAFEGTGRSWQGSSFDVQEMEGLGGVMKRKIKKLQLIGASVAVGDDGRDGKSKYLEREMQGKQRSWCAWCDRVVPSKKDRQDCVDV